MAELDISEFADVLRARKHRLDAANTAARDRISEHRSAGKSLREHFRGLAGELQAAMDSAGLTGIGLTMDNLEWGFILVGQVAYDPSADWSAGKSRSLGVEVRVTMQSYEEGRVSIQSSIAKVTRTNASIDQVILWERNDDYLVRGAQEQVVLSAVAAEIRENFRPLARQVIAEALSLP